MNSSLSIIDRLAVVATKALPAVIGVVCLLIVLSVGSNLSSPHFWFDEAGQYWIAMGQNHFFPAHSPMGSLEAVWQNSKHSIADPGGFTLLVRLWSKLFGSSPVTLRLLPALFGAVFFALLFIWCRRNCLSSYIACAISAFLLTLPNLEGELVEFRPYSMEICGVLALGLATLLFLEKPARLTLAAWILVDVVFLLSRYSFVVYSLAACSLLILRFFSLRSHRLLIAIAVGVSLLWMSAIYFFMLRYQSADATPPPYVQQYMIWHHLERIPAILEHNFLSRGTIGKTAFLAAILAILAMKNFRSMPLFVIQPQQIFRSVNLAVFIVAADVGWFLLSAVGRMPWDALQRWSLSEQGLTALAIPALLGLLRPAIMQQAPGPVRTFLLPAALSACLAICLISLSITMRFNRNNIVGEDLIDALSVVDCHHNDQVDIMLENGLWAQYRYLTERSGILIPCENRMRVHIHSGDDLQAFAKAGLSLSPDVTFIFGSWDKGALNALRGYVGSTASTEVHEFGYSGFTKVLSVHRTD
jgi:hypothetical protein